MTRVREDTARGRQVARLGKRRAGLEQEARDQRLVERQLLGMRPLQSTPAA
jgi:hypothetical protein